jgi:hypothetical protein
MPKRIAPTGRQKSLVFLHFAVFAIATVACWALYQGKSTEWAYPWPAWTTAAWGLLLLGHFCVVFASYEDKGLTEYERQDNA